MAKLSKALAAGAAVLAVTAAGAVTYAQMGHGGGHGRMGQMGMGHMGDQGMGHGGMMGQRGVSATRLESLKSDLAIRPEQTAAWETYAKHVTDTAAERRRVLENVDRDAVHNMKPGERQAFRDSMRKQRDQDRANVTASAEKLLAVLDDAQKSKARLSLPGLAASGHGQGMGQGHGRMGGGQGMGQGMGGGRGHQ